MIHFQAMGDWSLQVVVQSYIGTEDAFEEIRFNQEFLFLMMRTAEKIGLQFAFPTQSQLVRVESLPQQRQ